MVRLGVAAVLAAPDFGLPPASLRTLKVTWLLTNRGTVGILNATLRVHLLHNGAEVREIARWFPINLSPGAQGGPGIVDWAIRETDSPGKYGLHVVAKDSLGNVLAEAGRSDMVTVEAPTQALASFNFTVLNAPAGFTDFLAFWWDGSTWIQEPRGWLPIGQVAAFLNVRPDGFFGFYLNPPLSDFFGPFGPVTARTGDIWVYDMAMQQLRKQ